MDIRRARPAQALPGFPLVASRKPDSGINHEVLGADICNGLKLKKIRMSRFLSDKRAFPIDEESDGRPRKCVLADSATTR